MYDLLVPIVLKSESLNCLEPLWSLLVLARVALPLRFTLCRLQVQRPSEMQLARSRCRHDRYHRRKHRVLRECWHVL
jgi:hypothetical protein